MIAIIRLCHIRGLSFILQYDVVRDLNATGNTAIADINTVIIVLTNKYITLILGIGALLHVTELSALS